MTLEFCPSILFTESRKDRKGDLIMGEIVELIPPEKIQRYAVYSIRNSTDEGLLYTRSFIVIKNGYGVITRFTRLQEFTGVYENHTYKPLTSNPEGKMYFVVAMLNYVLVDHGAENGIRHVFDITKPMLAAFFDAYAMETLPDGGHRSAERVERCISCVTLFMYKLAWKYGGYMKIKRAELYAERTFFTRKGKQIKKKVPDFQATGIVDENGIFRDIPTKALEMLISMAFRYAPDIAFAMCLQAFAGLRAGEAMNVRQECSPYGPGIILTEVGGQVRGIKIDLRKELVLRSDGADIGLIKKTRIQEVYPPFVGTVAMAYRLHRQFLETVSFEEEYAPMFVNSNGMAMSYESYRLKFKSLVNDHLRQELVKSSDPELKIYGQMLYENSLGTHSLRHWFTVQLVLRGEDIGTIQSFRGDKNPETAFQYLQNKGELVRELENANSQLLDELMKIGGDIYGNR